MSWKPRVHVDKEEASLSLPRRLASLEPDRYSPWVTIHVDFDLGDHERALEILNRLYFEAKEQIRSTAPITSVGTESPCPSTTSPTSQPSSPEQTSSGH